MCGIIGSTTYGINRTILNQIYHRGPDARGVYTDKFISLGHTRLSIIDINNGSQPMLSDDKQAIIVFNGEIYNFKDLKKDLGNCKTNSDTEVLLKYYQTHGIEKTLNDINGMFAFAIYDKEKNKLFLARDRVGIKPLYYSDYQGELTFCSEINPIKNFIGVDQLSIDEMSVSLFFNLFYIPSPKTIWKEIKSLRAGHYIEYDLFNKKQQIKQYWKLEKHLDKVDNLDELESIIRDSVRLRMQSDVPYGAYLSGGVDSSLIVKHMSDVEKYIKTFTAQIKDKELDESEYGKHVANKCNTDHTNLPVEYSSIQLNFLREIAKNFGQPFADSSIVPTFLISKKISEKVTVALGGDGADELFCGYNKYDNINGDIKTSFFRNKNFDFLEERYKMDSYKYLLSLLPYEAETEKELMRLLDVHIFLEGDILQKIDRTSMTSSLEVRVPFLDHRVVEYSNRLNNEILYGKIRKLAVKRILEKYFTSSFVNRSKIGFMLNTDGWVENLYNHVQPFNTLKKSKIFKNEFRNIDNPYLKFAIVMFSLWYEENYV